MLRELHREYGKTEHTPGILSGEDMRLINEKLHLKEMNELGLRNLRDFTVLFFVNMKHDAEDTFRDALSDEMSAITAAIDHRIFDLGGEV